MQNNWRDKGENIAKIFQMEVREKKRIGSNIFSRVSTRKGGSKYTSPYANLKPKEVRLMSGDVKVFNIYETVMSFNDFVKRPKEQQLTIMNKWREKFPNEVIIKGLGCGKTQYYKLLSELGIKKEYKKRVSVIKSTGKNNSKDFYIKVDLDKYKEELIDIETFKQMNRDDRATLLFNYLEYYSVKELSLQWDVTIQYLHNMIYKFRNLEKKGKIKVNRDFLDKNGSVAITPSQEQMKIEEVESETSIEDTEIIELQDDIIETPIEEEPTPKITSVINEMRKENVEESKSSINIQFTKELTPMELIQQIQSLTFLLDHNQKYKFEFKVNN